MSGYRSGADHFFKFFAINLLSHFVNVTFAFWCVSIRRSFAEASLIANASYTFISLSCGYFIQAQSIPVYLRWTKYIGYVYWGFAGSTSNRVSITKRLLMIEFNDNFFDCPYGDASNPACTAYTGNYVMDQLGIPRSYVATSCLALIGFFVFYILTGWLFLQFLPVQIHFSEQVQSPDEGSGTAEAIIRAKSVEQRPAEVTVRLQDLKLWVDKRGLLKKSRVDLLQGITADFEPGQVNVIMGPSGYQIRVNN